MTPAWLNRGFSASAFWLRLDVHNPTAGFLERWLSLGVPRLEDVRFYLYPDGQRQPLKVVLAGNRQPLEQREVPSAVSVVSLLLNYFPEEKQPEEDTYKISKYAYGTDYHFVIKDKLKELLNSKE